MTITPPGAGTFTALHLIVLALLILAALALIVVGVRRSRARRVSERRVDAEAVQAGIPEQSAAPSPDTFRGAPPLDRAAVGVAPIPRAYDFARPRPVASEPREAEPHPVPLADERIAAAAPMDANPATLADPTPADGAVTQLKGLGPKVATRLAELGLSSVGQIAALDADEAAAVDAQLGPFAGRLHRDRWIEQARFLAAGDIKGFEAVFGRL